MHLFDCIFQSNGTLICIHKLLLCRRDEKYSFPFGKNNVNANWISWKHCFDLNPAPTWYIYKKIWKISFCFCLNFSCHIFFFHHCRLWMAYNYKMLKIVGQPTAHSRHSVCFRLGRVIYKYNVYVVRIKCVWRMCIWLLFALRMFMKHSTIKIYTISRLNTTSYEVSVPSLTSNRRQNTNINKKNLHIVDCVHSLFGRKRKSTHLWKINL